ncbi:MAG: hypothetical protein QNJ74_04435 [Trichodesmium sp. MO_231.B1]|nr:hypothetical protein [Trichodesmium sp. MO_231.B1]
MRCRLTQPTTNFPASDRLSPVLPFPRGVRGDKPTDRLYLEVLIAARENHQ